MNEIKNITLDGINYVDENGNQQFIEFESCHQNNLIDIEKRMDSEFTDDEKEFWKKAKYVGTRYALSNPPCLILYTVPPTEFEFESRDKLSEILSRIKRSGWRTRDGE